MVGLDGLRVTCSVRAFVVPAHPAKGAVKPGFVVIKDGQAGELPDL